MVEPIKQAALSESLQDYLEAVYLLAQRHGVARMKEIASLVGVGKSSATGAIQAPLSAAWSITILTSM